MDRGPSRKLTSPERWGRFSVAGELSEEERAQLDHALVSAATLLSQTYEVETQLIPPIEQLDIAQTAETIARLGSPPLRVNMARDLATAGYKIEEMEPLLRSILPSDSDGNDQSLQELLAQLLDLGPTVEWPDFPPGRPREPSDPPPDEPPPPGAA
jgi:hypothetical protein